MNWYDELSGAMSIAESIEQASRLMTVPDFSEMVIPNPEAGIHRLGVSESAIEQAVINMERISTVLPVDRFYERHISAIEAAMNQPGLSDI